MSVVCESTDIYDDLDQSLAILSHCSVLCPHKKKGRT